MKNHVIALIILITIAGCKKEGGKYCPVLTSSNTDHLVDLSPVRDIPQIMDTLTKYPQLQVYRINAGKGFDPGSYWANVSCNVYYKGLPIFRSGYYMYYSTFVTEYNNTNGKIPLKIDISIEPVVTRNEAIQRAEEYQDFEHCPFTQLGITNLGTDSLPDYKLSWRIMGAESGYPIMEIDAQNKNILYSDDGLRY
jgi:hypothetical protein